MTKHAPGPWSVFRDGDGKLYVATLDGAMVAIVVEGDVSSDSDANADLICAAPDLLDGLMQSNSQLERAADAIEKGCYDEALLHCRAMPRRRFSPIAKATGEKA